MVTFKISTIREKSIPIIIMTIIIHNEKSIIFKQLLKLTKEYNIDITSLDFKFSDSDTIPALKEVEETIRKMFKIRDRITLNRIRHTNVNTNRLVKLIKISEKMEYVKII